MTGLHTGHATVRGNKGINTPKHDGQDGRIPLRKQDVTVATLLKQAGYATGITGKWGLGEPGSTGLPNDHGFDEWLGYLNQDHAPFYFSDYLWLNKSKIAVEGNSNGKQEQYTHDLFTKFALEFIRKNRGRPFFLYIPYCIPHKRYEIPTVDPYQNRPWEDEAKVHAAMITRLDNDVGRILTLLRELNIDKKTIVFFCSDNGSARGWEGLFDSCGPLREKKGSIYEGGIRTPMIVRWPDKVEKGEVNSTPWYFADVLPTLCELGGAETPIEVDGISVLETILGRKQHLDGRYMYWEQVKGNKNLQQAVLYGKWKLVRLGSNERLELYDLSEDIGETNDLAEEYPEVVADLEAYLKGVRTESPHWPTI
jgi:arylsulfatase A-like enzyme